MARKSSGLERGQSGSPAVREEASRNWHNRTIWTRDNLHVLRGMNSGTVDLIYLDPPFNSNRTYSAPIGSQAAGAAFKDAWTFDDADRVYLALLQERDPTTFAIIDAARLAHGKGMGAYLGMMAQRLVEMRRVLKPTGSIYLHCDPFASHYLKTLMDSLFGHNNFRNEIIWCYPPKGRAPRLGFHHKHDTIFYYGRTDEGRFNHQYTRLNSYQRGKFSKKDEDGRAYKEFKGRRTYLDESHGRPVPSWWDDIGQTGQSRKEYIGYPTQKPLALLDRIIRASSNEGDVVLDPFCGCATAAVAAERLQREWIGIDISAKAAELVTTRLHGILDEVPLYRDGTVVHRTDQPGRTDLGDLPHYRTHLDSLYGAQEGFCGGCGEHFRKRNLTVDHIVPRAHGGTDHVENLWLLCAACNSSKGTRSQEQFLKERMQKRAALFPWLFD